MTLNAVAIVAGAIGALAGATSAIFWYAASRVPPVYNTAVLDVNPHEKRRIDQRTKLNANAAIGAAIAVGCQAVILLLDMIQNSN